MTTCGHGMKGLIVLANHEGKGLLELSATGTVMTLLIEASGFTSPNELAGDFLG